MRRAPKNPDTLLGSHALVAIALGPTVTREQQLEGLSREVVRRVQMARKNARLQLDSRIAVELTLPTELREAAELHRDYLAAETLAVSVQFVEQAKGSFVEQGEIDGAPVTVAITVQG